MKNKFVELFKFIMKNTYLIRMWNINWNQKLKKNNKINQNMIILKQIMNFNIIKKKNLTIIMIIM